MKGPESAEVAEFRAQKIRKVECQRKNNSDEGGEYQEPHFSQAPIALSEIARDCLHKSFTIIDRKRKKSNVRLLRFLSVVKEQLSIPILHKVLKGAEKTA
jgi:hypothetical protein